MALNDVTFVKGRGGLGRPLAGEDHISGLLYYSNTLPTGFGTDHVKTIFSLEEAEALGITGDYAYETIATGGKIKIDTAVVDSTITVKVKNEVIGSVKLATDEEADAATALREAINANTAVHGYTAGTGLTADIVTLTAPRGTGSTIHTTALAVTDEGSATTVTAFTGGVNDPLVVLWYHIKEYFRIQPRGVLYVGIFDVPGGAHDFEELSTLQNTAAEGVIRQVAVYTTKDFDFEETSDITALHNIAEELSTVQKAPLSILYAPNIAGLEDDEDEPVTASALPDLSASPTTGSYVSVVIGQDGNSMGKELFSYTGKSISCVGAALGAVSRSKVSENIGWVKNFNMAGGELDVIAFGDGSEYRNYTEGSLGIINDHHYVFLRKHIGITGSYFNDSHTAVSETSDYSTIENNRTIDKAIRNIRTFLIPELMGPLFVDPDTGYLSEDTIAYFQNLASRPLEQMQREQELSGFLVTINPQQDVLGESKLVITVKLVPVGVARQIQVNIGFTVKIS